MALFGDPNLLISIEMTEGMEIIAREPSSALISLRKRPEKSRFFKTSIVFICLFIATLLLQYAGDAYTSELSGYPDEPAHFITGLMIRDYVAAGFPTSPIAYAEGYYFYYPKVAFGMWGPLLHVAEAAWTLIFPATRNSVIVLMALISSLTATLIFLALSDEVSEALAFLAALLFVCAPTVQTYTGMIMADGLVALLDFCAALAFGRYLTVGSLKYSCWFGVFACLSVLSKGNGVALVLLPAFAVLFTGRFSLLKQKSFWVGSAVIACIGGPWQYYSATALSDIVIRHPGWAFVMFYTKATATMLGVALLPIVLVGVYSRVFASGSPRRLDGKWAAAAALICSVWAFHSLIPATSSEYRYLIAVIPPMLMFLMAGVVQIATWVSLPAFSLSYRTWAFGAAVAALVFATTFTIPKKLHHGFEEVAELLERPAYTHSEILVSSNGCGEGLLISEMATREKRPTHVILRASKMLAESDWDGERYKEMFHTPNEVLDFLKSIAVGVVVIDNDPGSQPAPRHHVLLKQAVAAFPGEWEALGSYPQQSRADIPANIEVYRLRSTSDSTRPKIRINLPHTLGRSIER